MRYTCSGIGLREVRDEDVDQRIPRLIEVGAQHVRVRLLSLVLDAMYQIGNKSQNRYVATVPQPSVRHRIARRARVCE